MFAPADGRPPGVAEKLAAGAATGMEPLTCACLRQRVRHGIAGASIRHGRLWPRSAAILAAAAVYTVALRSLPCCCRKFLGTAST
eukprot:353436-Chlamydomonas_euryale.AAC.2